MEPIDVRQLIIDTINNKGITWVQAAKDLDIGRMTLYQWAGPNRYLPPGVEYAQTIARFADEDSALVRYSLLHLHGELTDDEFQALVNHRHGVDKARAVEPTPQDHDSLLYQDASISYATASTSRYRRLQHRGHCIASPRLSDRLSTRTMMPMAQGGARL